MNATSSPCCYSPPRAYTGSSPGRRLGPVSPGLVCPGITGIFGASRPGSQPEAPGFKNRAADPFYLLLARSLADDFYPVGLGGLFAEIRPGSPYLALAGDFRGSDLFSIASYFFKTLYLADEPPTEGNPRRKKCGIGAAGACVRLLFF